MIALDLFCGAGGASKGLSNAGFEVHGVDNKWQPRYPFEFWKQDAMVSPLVYSPWVDFIWASPPCQKYSKMTKRWGQPDHPDYIGILRQILIGTGKPFVLENVPGAPLKNVTVLCGSMFGLKVRRHRLFEAHGFRIPEPPPHDHSYKVVGVYGETGGSSKRDGIKFGGIDAWREAMGIDWMTSKELAQAIPPAYSEYIARAYLDTLGR